MTDNINPRSLPRKKEGDALGATHVNYLSDATERFNEQVGHGYGVSSDGHHTSLPPFNQRTFAVSALGCDGNAAYYTIKPRYYDSANGTWATDTDADGFCLDPTDFGLEYAVDDILTAYWDEQRGAWIPMSGAAGGSSGNESTCCGYARNYGSVHLTNGSHISSIIRFRAPSVDCCAGANSWGVDTVDLIWVSGDTFRSERRVCCEDPELGLTAYTFFELVISSKALYLYKDNGVGVNQSVIMQWAAVDPYVPQSPSRFSIDSTKTSAACIHCVDDICLAPAQPDSVDCTGSIICVGTNKPDILVASSGLSLVDQDYFGTVGGVPVVVSGPNLNAVSLVFEKTEPFPPCYKEILIPTTNPHTGEPDDANYSVKITLAENVAAAGTNPLAPLLQMLIRVGLWVEYSPGLYGYVRSIMASYVYLLSPPHGYVRCEDPFEIKLLREWDITAAGFGLNPAGQSLSEVDSGFNYTGWPNEIVLNGLSSYLPSICDPSLPDTPPAIP